MHQLMYVFLSCTSYQCAFNSCVFVYVCVSVDLAYWSLVQGVESLIFLGCQIHSFLLSECVFLNFPKNQFPRQEFCLGKNGCTICLFHFANCKYRGFFLRTCHRSADSNHSGSPSRFFHLFATIVGRVIGVSRENPPPREPEIVDSVFSIFCVRCTGK